jgi:hypothetical protein
VGLAESERAARFGCTCDESGVRRGAPVASGAVIARGESVDQDP